MIHLGLNSNKDDVMTFKSVDETRYTGKLKVTLVENTEYKITYKIIKHSLLGWILGVADPICLCGPSVLVGNKRHVYRQSVLVLFFVF